MNRLKKFFLKIFKFAKPDNSVQKNIKPVIKDYFFGDLSIVLNEYHVLESYQNSFPLYDRFLPIFCKDFEGLIIDVGANIGDTSIAIFSKNKKSFIVGIEADSNFFKSCMENITRNHLSSRFLGINKFLTTKKGHFLIQKNESLSTGSMDTNEKDGQDNTISFVELMNSIPDMKGVKFDLLKIDTDSFDWDVLDSFSEYLENATFKPRFVFFEMQTFSNSGIGDLNERDLIEKKYYQAIEKLISNGYGNLCLFDNFGTLIKTVNSLDKIIEINSYIRHSQIYNKHTTIHYLDILAYGDNEIDFVKKRLVDFYKSFN